MKFCSTADLREKDVINLCDGSRLGCPEDFEIDIACGRIVALIVNCDDRLFGFGKHDEIAVPWEKIKCIGDDAVLVRLDSSELQCCKREYRKKKSGKTKL